MNAIDFTPLYRSTVGFDRLASLLDNAMQQNTGNGYPPYDIESVDENQYTITLALAGFTEDDLDIQTERGVLTIRGKQADEKSGHYLHRGIAKRAFEKKFQLADHVEITQAQLVNGLLSISLVKEVPESMKPKRISIGGADRSNSVDKDRVATEEKLAVA